MYKLMFALFMFGLPICGYAQPNLVFTCYDLEPGSGDSSPDYFTEFNGKFYFNANTVATGKDMWVSDGTSIGTLTKDIIPGSQGGSPHNFIEVSGKLYFIHSNDKLWATDSFGNNAHIILDTSISGLYPSVSDDTIAVLNGKLLFRGSNNFGSELWTSDGTTIGTYMIKDIHSGSGHGFPDHLTVFNGRVFFSAHDNTNGVELWASDGTNTGTQLIKNINPSSNNSNPSLFIPYGTNIFFNANDGANGYELWVSDGTDAGTKMLKDINPGAASSNPNSMIKYNGKLYFIADDGVHGTELWVTDGTSLGTYMIKDINSGLANGVQTGEIIIFNNQLYFAADDGINGVELWTSNGTDAGTVLIKDMFIGVNSSSPRTFIVYKNHLYFVAGITSFSNRQLWVSDGTATNTKIVAPSGTTGISPLLFSDRLFLYTIDSTLYFKAGFTSTGRELWSMKDTTDYSYISSINYTNSFNIYPNPNNGTFTLTTANAFKYGIVHVYDMIGREVYESTINSRSSIINLYNPPGIYIVKLQLDDIVLTKKIKID